jgi:hypothetical protein
MLLLFYSTLKALDYTGQITVHFAKREFQDRVTTGHE